MALHYCLIYEVEKPIKLEISFGIEIIVEGSLILSFKFNAASSASYNQESIYNQAFYCYCFKTMDESSLSFFIGVLDMGKIIETYNSHCT